MKYLIPLLLVANLAYAQDEPSVIIPDYTGTQESE
jgi:hypothetical protein